MGLGVNFSLLYFIAKMEVTKSNSIVCLYEYGEILNSDSQSIQYLYYT